MGRSTLRALRALATDGSKPLVAGPWLSEVGFELLYWLPLLAWFRDEHGIPPESVIAVTRGGAGVWYGHVAAQTVDVFDRVGPDDLRRLRQARVARLGSEKQGRVDPFETRLLDDLVPDGGARIHPALMYRLFNVAWNYAPHDLADMRRRLRYEPLPPPPRSLPSGALPDGYVALKAYFSHSFPDTPANRAFLTRLVSDLPERQPVVVLRTGVRLDDHEDCVPTGASVFDASPLLSDPTRNLAVQSEIVHGARALVATYGGFSYLGPFLGVPTYSFYSTPWFNPVHLEIFRHALAEIGLSDEYVPHLTEEFRLEAGAPGLA